MKPTTGGANAFFSVFDTEKTPEFLKFVQMLEMFGWNIYSSGGTFDFLIDGGIKATKAEDLTGLPSMFRGRVKTLHPAVLSGMIVSEDLLPELAEREYIEFKLVYVTLYPLAKELARDGATFESCIEKTDVGGPTMLQAACKSCRVLVITSPEQLQSVMDWINGGCQDEGEFIYQLATDALVHCAEYAFLAAKVRQTFRPIAVVPG